LQSCDTASPNHGLWTKCGEKWIASKSAYGLDTGKSLAQHKET
jgi:hypothetical protein